jgi:molybdopterin converting factor small subunit
MAICVEFYGIVRQRAGTAAVELAVDGPLTLAEVLERIASRFPRVASECLCGNRLRSGYVANVDGARFLSDPDTELPDGSVLLILSADAGG